MQTVPIQKTHGVDVKPSLVMDSRTDIEITWDPENVFPQVETANTFMVDIYIYTYNYKTSKWKLNSRKLNQTNNGHAELRMGPLNKVVVATCIHVTVGQIENSNSSFDNVRKLIESLHSTKSIPFPSRVGLWSGLFFSVFNSRTATVTDKSAKTIRRNIFNKKM